MTDLLIAAVVFAWLNAIYAVACWYRWRKEK